MNEEAKYTRMLAQSVKIKFESYKQKFVIFVLYLYPFGNYPLPYMIYTNLADSQQLPHMAKHN